MKFKNLLLKYWANFIIYMYNHNFANMYSLIWTGFSGERCGPWASCSSPNQCYDIIIALSKSVYWFEIFFMCLQLIFVCLFFIPLESFSLIWRRHHYRWRVAKFDLCSELMAIEQWGFFSVPLLLWHGTSVYNGHLRGPVTITLVAERLAVELSLLALATWISQGWDSNNKPSLCDTNALTDCVTAAEIHEVN